MTAYTVNVAVIPVPVVKKTVSLMTAYTVNVAVIHVPVVKKTVSLKQAMKLETGRFISAGVDAVLDYDHIISPTPITNIILDRSLPEFVENNYPMFVEFLKAYYEWMEQVKQPHEIIQHLREYRDIDRTIDDFISYFRDEYLINIPDDILADKRLLVKQIHEFYKNKGNENSYKFLFRILYNEDIELYYPKKDILRVSDGKWTQDVSIKIKGTPFNGNFSPLFNSVLTGETSKASATVSTVTIVDEQGYNNTDNLLELTLSSLRGVFVAGENIVLTAGYYTSQIIHDIHIVVEEVYKGFTIYNPGTGYGINDAISVFNYADKKVASGVVTDVGKGPVTELTIDAAGVGYAGVYRDIDKLMYIPLNDPYSTFPILGNATIESMSHGGIGDEPLDTSITLETVYTGTGDAIAITDTPNPIGTGAQGVVWHVDAAGGILSVKLLAGGRDYSNPRADVISTTGSGAAISAQGGGGSILAAKLLNFPVVNRADNNNNILTVSFATNNTANLSMTPEGGTIQYPGYYLNTDGQLSSDKKIQDSFFYQDYSYVILSVITQTKWNDIVNKIIHPAGLKVFGRLKFVVSTPEVPSVSISSVQVIKALATTPAAKGIYNVYGKSVRLIRGNLNTLAAERGTYNSIGRSAAAESGSIGTLKAQPTTYTLTPTGIVNLKLG